jgi:hypothetical protein
MRCADVRPYLSAFVDGELAEPLRSQMARHLAGCAECAARAASYRATDALLARLPGSAPSPEVYHAVMAAAREQNAEPVERETLPAPLAGLAARQLRVVRPEPRQSDVPAALSGARAKSWIATVAPAVAAVLLVTLAALAFRGLVTLPHESGPATTPTPALTILEQTQTQVAVVSRTAKLPFTPVLPTYAPNGASSVDVSLGYADDKTTVTYLDIVWNVTPSGYLRKIHIRESANGYPYPGYTLDNSGDATGWQLIDKRSWQPLKNEHPEQLTSTTFYQAVAAGQYQENALYVAVEAIGTSPSSSRDSLLATLRQVTLSMDGEQKQIPLASLQTTGLILHYKAQTRVAPGQTPAWSVEVYVNPANDAQSVAVSVNGKLRYVDVSQGSQGYRWDAQTGVYANGPRSLFSGDMNPNINGNQNVTHIFSSPGEFLQTGLLWYSGQNAKVGNATAYDYRLVSAPNLTHVYIDQRTNQVVKVDVDTSKTWNSPPPTDVPQLYGQDNCSYFTLIEYVASAPDETFSLAPPRSSQQGAVPATVTCL